MTRLPAFARSTGAFAVGPAVGLITAPVLARALGPEGRGTLAAVLQPLTLADSLAAFGVPVATTYFIARKYSARRVSRMGYVGVLVLSIVAFTALGAYAIAVLPKHGLDPKVTTLLYVSVIPGALIAIRRAMWAGVARWTLLDGERLMTALSRGLVIIALGIAGVSSAVLFATGPIVFGLTVSLLLWKRYPVEPAGCLAPKRSRFASYAALSGLSAVATTASARIDQALLPVFASSASLGQYAVAVTVAEIPLVIGLVLARNLLTEAANGQPARMLVKTCLLGLGATCAVAAVIYVVTSTLVPKIFGAEFVPAAAVSQVLLLGAVATVATNAACAVLNGRGAPQLAMLPNFLSAGLVVGYLLIVGGDVILVRLAFAVATAQASAAALAILLAWRSLKSARPE